MHVKCLAECLGHWKRLLNDYGHFPEFSRSEMREEAHLQPGRKMRALCDSSNGPGS